MMTNPPEISTVIQQDNWSALRNYTAARIALGNTGGALPLSEVLALKMAHAHARDAVYAALDETMIADGLQRFRVPLITASSYARDRGQYLLDPGAGRKLDPSSVIMPENEIIAGGVTIIISDGLSATAVNKHILPLLSELIPRLAEQDKRINALALVKQGRVAISDEIGALTGAAMSIILIGERPGLTAADSLGAYLTFDPKPGLTDESRNCVSNIHNGGLSYAVAAAKISYLVNAAFELRRSGVMLKEGDGLIED